MIVKTQKEEFIDYLSDASNFEGNASKVYIPENISELKEIIRECYKNSTSITLSAARTGLTGGCVPLDGVVISTEKLNKIIQIDSKTRTVILEPGVLIQHLQNELKHQGLFYPPNPTEQNSTIGGNIATNASGAKTFKYGATRNYVKSLKMILSDGDEIHLKRGDVVEKNGSLSIPTINGNKYELVIKNINFPNIKHTAGYYIKEGMDAVDLFVGSEGTLSIIYEIELKILELPEEVLGGIAFFDNNDSLLEFVEQMRTRSLKENQELNLDARLIEYFDKYSLRLLREKYPEIPENSIGSIWFEQEYKTKDEDELLDIYYNFIKQYTSLVDSTWLATDDKTHLRLTEFRHTLPVLVFEIISANNSFKIGTDTAVPFEHFKSYFGYMNDVLANSGLSFFTWGHIGNAHLHANLISSNDSEFETAQTVYMTLIKKALELKGTVSAEHGIGKMKRKYFHEMFGNETIDYMFSIKKNFDKNLILNRENLFNY